MTSNQYVICVQTTVHETCTKHARNNEPLPIPHCEHYADYAQGCQICNNKFEDDDTVRWTSCHVFHDSCFTRFILNGSTHCPVCQESIIPYVDEDMDPDTDYYFKHINSNW